MVFLKFVLICLTVYYVIKIIAPYLVRYFFRRMEKKMRQASQNQAPPFKTPKKSKKPFKKVGEYIDFEEID